MAMQTDFREIEYILKQYDVMGTPFYTVYQGKDYKFDHIEDDLESGRAYLDQQLQAIKYFGNTAQFKITFYRELTDKGKFNQENIKGSNTFKVISEEDADGMPYWEKKRGIVSPELKELRELVAAQQSQINALLEDADEEEEPGVLGGLMGHLSPILQNPQVQQAIAAKISGLLDKFIPDISGKTMYMQPTTTLGSASQAKQDPDQDDQTILTMAIQKLFAAGVTVDDMKKLADMTENPKQFSFLLTMLRK